MKTGPTKTEPSRNAADNTGGAALPEIGEVLDGKYAIEARLGEGGMGVVFAARHAKLGQRAALKFLLPHLLARPLVKERFLREARAAVAITNDHVTRVLDVGELPSGLPYIVMEFLEGSDLGTLLDERGPLGVDDAAGYVLEASEAIAEAHALGIVHRDIKPSNLFLVDKSDGTQLIKVLDFGIAKSITEDAAAGKLTGTNESMGSPQYMSPEQVRDAKVADERTDIWALGVVLYELVAGVPPFAGDSVPAVCAKILTDTPKSLSEAGPDVPKGFVDAVHRCLEKNPDDRFEDLGGLARALAPFSPSRASSAERVQKLLAGRRHSVVTRSARMATLAQATTLAVDAVTGPKIDLAPRGRLWIVAVAVLAALGVGIAVGNRSSDSPAPAGSNAAGNSPTQAAAPTLTMVSVQPPEASRSAALVTDPEPAVSSPTVSPAEPYAGASTAKPNAKAGAGTVKPKVTAEPKTAPTGDPYGDRK